IRVRRRPKVEGVLRNLLQSNTLPITCDQLDPPRLVNAAEHHALLVHMQPWVKHAATGEARQQTLLLELRQILDLATRVEPVVDPDNLLLPGHHAISPGRTSTRARAPHSSSSVTRRSTPRSTFSLVITSAAGITETARPSRRISKS